MSISERYAEYELWVLANPKRFVVDNTNIVSTDTLVGSKVLEVTTAKGTTSTSVRVDTNKADLDGFITWSKQVCGC